MLKHNGCRYRRTDLPERKDVGLRVKRVEGGHRSVGYRAYCPQHLRSQVADCAARQIERLRPETTS